MKLKLFPLIFVFLLISCASDLSQKQLNHSLLYSQSMYTIEVTKRSVDGRITSHGAMGVVVDRENDTCLIATPAHVVNFEHHNVEIIKVVPWGIDEQTKPEVLYADLVYNDDVVDFSLLRLDGGDSCYPVLIDGHSVYGLGQNSLAHGYPKLIFNSVEELNKSVSSGVISMRVKNYFQDGLDALIFDGRVSPGFSGGAIYTTSDTGGDEEFVGMIIEKLNVDGYQDMTVVMPYPVIRVLTNKALARIKLEN